MKNFPFLFINHDTFCSETVTSRHIKQLKDITLKMSLNILMKLYRKFQIKKQ